MRQLFCIALWPETSCAVALWHFFPLAEWILCCLHIIFISASMVTVPPQDQLNISRMHKLHTQSFLNTGPSAVHTYHAFMHTHLLYKDSLMSEYSGMSGIVSLQHSSLLHRKHTCIPRFYLGCGHISINAQYRSLVVVLIWFWRFHFGT